MKKIKSSWKKVPVRGWKCASCGEELVHPDDAQRAIEIERAFKKNLLTVKVRKVGKSSVVTVPRPLMEVERLKAGQTFKWSVDGKKLVLTPSS